MLYSNRALLEFMVIFLTKLPKFKKPNYHALNTVFNIRTISLSFFHLPDASLYTLDFADISELASFQSTHQLYVVHNLVVRTFRFRVIAIQIVAHQGFGYKKRK